MGGIRDGYSNFKFFEAIAPQSFSGTAITGGTVDKQGFETLTFVVQAGEGSGLASASVSVTSCGYVRMWHATSNAAGTLVWSRCSAEQILVDIKLSGAAAGSHTSDFISGSMGILNVSNAGSGLANGTFFCLGGLSADLMSYWESKAYAAGYIGDHRWIRLTVSASAAAEASSIAVTALAILGLEADWPINVIRKTSTLGPVL